MENLLPGCDVRSVPSLVVRPRLPVVGLEAGALGLRVVCSRTKPLAPSGFDMFSGHISTVSTSYLKCVTSFSY